MDGVAAWAVVGAEVPAREALCACVRLRKLYRVLPSVDVTAAWHTRSPEALRTVTASAGLATAVQATGPPQEAEAMAARKAVTMEPMTLTSLMNIRFDLDLAGSR